VSRERFHFRLPGLRVDFVKTPSAARQAIAMQGRFTRGSVMWELSNEGEHAMKRASIAAALVALAGCAAVTPTQVSTVEPTREAKMAFDVTNGNPVVVNKTLETIELTRKQLLDQGVTPHIVVTFRGDASYFTQDSLAAVKEADRAEALAVKARIREMRKSGEVESFEQCNIPLGPRKLNPKELMSEVKLVPNGWIALVNYQQKGYAYIVP
jgi:intracellular sulfur oxidation DsrE/DsrF family protein